MQHGNNYCVKCGEPIYGQEINYSSGEGPYHASCHNDLFYEEFKDLNFEIDFPSKKKKLKIYGDDSVDDKGV